jgi:hypothetical protein
LRGELREIDFVNIDLFFFDEVQKEIERAFEDFKFYFVFGHFLARSLAGNLKAAMANGNAFTGFWKVAPKKIPANTTSEFPRQKAKVFTTRKSVPGLIVLAGVWWNK